MRDIAPERAEVVIVDDDAAILAIISDILRDEGYTPVTFRDGAQAESYVSRHAPRLVMTDLRLPGMSGYDLVLRLRNRCDPHLPIVVLSGVAEAAAAERLPVQEYLFKPFDLDDLCAVIKRLAPQTPPGYHPPSEVRAGDAQTW